MGKQRAQENPLSSIILLPIHFYYVFSLARLSPATNRPVSSYSQNSGLLQGRR